MQLCGHHRKAREPAHLFVGSQHSPAVLSRPALPSASEGSSDCGDLQAARSHHPLTCTAFKRSMASVAQASVNNENSFHSPPSDVSSVSGSARFRNQPAFKHSSHNDSLTPQSPTVFLVSAALFGKRASCERISNDVPGVNQSTGANPREVVEGPDFERWDFKHSGSRSHPPRLTRTVGFPTKGAPERTIPR